MEIASKHKYIMLRDFEGNTYGVNCGVVSIGKRNKTGVEKDLETYFISFKPISFMEYISTKTPFLK